MKQLSREQLEKRKAKAVRFTRDVVGDADRADQIEDESLESYAERRKIQLINPKRGTVMAKPLQEKVRNLQEQLADAEAEIETLEETNEELEEKLDEILDIAAPEEGEPEEEEEPGEDD